jgi:hypothetical protein
VSEPNLNTRERNVTPANIPQDLPDAAFGEKRFIFSELQKNGEWFLACISVLRRLSMLPYARFPVTRWYAVEVSGWDRTENFFVEKCELECKEESDKQVTLKRALFDNAVLLVRLLQFDESGRSHPVVFEAEWIRRTKRGLHQFRLNTVVPRRREPENPAA